MVFVCLLPPFVEADRFVISCVCLEYAPLYFVSILHISVGNFLFIKKYIYFENTFYANIYKYIISNICKIYNKILVGKDKNNFDFGRNVLRNKRKNNFEENLTIYI